MNDEVYFEVPKKPQSFTRKSTKVDEKESLKLYARGREHTRFFSRAVSMPVKTVAKLLETYDEWIKTVRVRPARYKRVREALANLDTKVIIIGVVMSREQFLLVGDYVKEYHPCPTPTGSDYTINNPTCNNVITWAVTYGCDKFLFAEFMQEYERVKPTLSSCAAFALDIGLKALPRFIEKRSKENASART